MKINNNLFNKYLNNRNIKKEIKDFNNLENLNSFFDYLKINIASSKRIKFWAERLLPNGEIVGEILNSHTLINKTNIPIEDGIFCQKIFGPIFNNKCLCKKYKGFKYKKFCEICKVELINSKIRKYRMGYINLVYPIVHIWYLKSIPNYFCLLLKLFDSKINLTIIENIIYSKNSLINLNDNINFKNINNKFNNILFGNELIKTAFENINLNIEIKKLRLLLNNSLILNFNKNLNIQKLYIQQIRILESFLNTKTNPSWMLLTVLPILPPALRPFSQLENGKVVSADINELYRFIINRNLKLINLQYLVNLPISIQIQERIILQEMIDLLIDNNKLTNNNFYINDNKLQSLTEILEGKYGLFRQYLLGKRVDFSARSIIVVDPQIKLNKCGLSYEILVELFYPFIVKELNKIKNLYINDIIILKLIKNKKPIIWAILNFLINQYSILLNRAPTLHKYGIQSFSPYIVFDKAIHLHPLVCIGFNADFDGDQMAIYLPLYQSSQLELKYLMKSSSNIISSSNDNLILKPTQEIIFGNFYLTLMFKNNFFYNKQIFNNNNEILLSYFQKKITLHTSILVKYIFNEYKFKIKNNKLLLYNKKLFLKFNIYEIKFLKIFCNNKIKNKYYIIINNGILIIWIINNKYYIITNLILETTAGREIFNKNLKNIKL